MHLVCYLRHGDRVFETCWTTRRGIEAGRSDDLTGRH